MIADLYEVPPKKAEDEMETLLEQLELVDAADDQIKSLFLRYAEENPAHLTSSCITRRSFFSTNPPVGWIREVPAPSGKFYRQRCELGCTVFMTTHILEIAERICDRVGIISKGQLIAIGTLAELQQKKQELHAQPTDTDQHQTQTLEDIFLDLTADA